MKDTDRLNSYLDTQLHKRAADKEQGPFPVQQAARRAEIVQAEHTPANTKLQNIALQAGGAPAMTDIEVATERGRHNRQAVLAKTMQAGAGTIKPKFPSKWHKEQQGTLTAGLAMATDGGSAADVAQASKLSQDMAGAPSRVAQRTIANDYEQSGGNLNRLFSTGSWGGKPDTAALKQYDELRKTMPAPDALKLIGKERGGEAELWLKHLIMDGIITAGVDNQGTDELTKTAGTRMTDQLNNYLDTQLQKRAADKELPLPVQLMQDGVDVAKTVGSGVGHAIDAAEAGSGAISAGADVAKTIGKGLKDTAVGGAKGAGIGALTGGALGAALTWALAKKPGAKEYLTGTGIGAGLGGILGAPAGAYAGMVKSAQEGIVPVSVKRTDQRAQYQRLLDMMMNPLARQRFNELKPAQQATMRANSPVLQDKLDGPLKLVPSKPPAAPIKKGAAETTEAPENVLDRIDAAVDLMHKEAAAEKYIKKGVNLLKDFFGKTKTSKALTAGSLGLGGAAGALHSHSQPEGEKNMLFPAITAAGTAWSTNPKYVKRTLANIKHARGIKGAETQTPMLKALATSAGLTGGSKAAEVGMRSMNRIDEIGKKLNDGTGKATKATEGMERGSKAFETIAEQLKDPAALVRTGAQEVVGGVAKGAKNVAGTAMDWIKNNKGLAAGGALGAVGTYIAYQKMAEAARRREIEEEEQIRARARRQYA